jgi:hypothetical protein
MDNPLGPICFAIVACFCVFLAMEHKHQPNANGAKAYSVDANPTNTSPSNSWVYETRLKTRYANRFMTFVFFGFVLVVMSIGCYWIVTR